MTPRNFRSTEFASCIRIERISLEGLPDRLAEKVANHNEAIDKLLTDRDNLANAKQDFDAATVGASDILNEKARGPAAALDAELNALRAINGLVQSTEPLWGETLAASEKAEEEASDAVGAAETEATQAIRTLGYEGLEADKVLNACPLVLNARETARRYVGRRQDVNTALTRCRQEGLESKVTEHIRRIAKSGDLAPA